MDKSRKTKKSEYDTKTGMPMNETNFESRLPQYLAESLERMKKSWKIVDSGKKDIHWDICWCELNADINSAEVENLISSEQAWYLRKKYLRMERQDNIMIDFSLNKWKEKSKKIVKCKNKNYETYSKNIFEIIDNITI